MSAPLAVISFIGVYAWSWHHETVTGGNSHLLVAGMPVMNEIFDDFM